MAIRESFSIQTEVQIRELDCLINSYVPKERINWHKEESIPSGSKNPLLNAGLS